MTEGYLDFGSRGTTFIIEKEDEFYILKYQPLDENSLSEWNTLKAMKGAAYVVQLIEAKEVDDIIIFVLSMGEQGTLSNYLNSNSADLSSKDIAGLFIKIMEGVSSIHSRGYVHADLKLDNIVINKNNNPIIIDFDIATKINSI